MELVSRRRHALLAAGSWCFCGGLKQDSIERTVGKVRRGQP